MEERGGRAGTNVLRAVIGKSLIKPEEVEGGTLSRAIAFVCSLRPSSPTNTQCP